MTPIRRENLRTFLDTITEKPTFIFSVVCQRRTPLYLRYEPVGPYVNGLICKYGDRTELATRRFRRGRGAKVVLQDQGMSRTMVVKGKRDNSPMKHWVSKGQELRFDPAEKGLYLVAGMYNDEEKDFGTGKRIGRHGQWRPFCFIDLNTTETIIYDGETYVVH